MEKLVILPHSERVLEPFGTNPYGKPKYRVVRADSRMQWWQGELAPKYPKCAGAWILEVWCPPSQYEPRAAWEAATLEDGRSSLGPFPTQGDYEMSYAFVDDKEAYLPGEQLLQTCVSLIEKGKAQTRSVRWSQIQQAQEDARKERMRKLSDMIRDAAPLRGGEAVRKHQDVLEAKTSMRPTLPPGPSVMKGMNS